MGSDGCYLFLMTGGCLRKVVDLIVLLISLFCYCAVLDVWYINFVFVVVVYCSCLLCASGCLGLLALSGFSVNSVVLWFIRHDSRLY